LGFSVNLIRQGRYYKAFEDDVPDDEELPDSIKKYAVSANSNDDSVSPPAPSASSAEPKPKRYVRA
jgi:hypothetical protein